MKKDIIAICVFLFLLVLPVKAQGTIIYLPLVIKESTDMAAENSWKILIPEATTNMALNPSGEIAGNFAAIGAATVTRSTTYQHYGLYSYRVQTAANNQGASFTLLALSNTTHYVTMRVRGVLPTTWKWSLNGGTNLLTPQLLEKLDDNWSLYGASFPAAQANTSVLLSVYQVGVGAGDFYLDGIQVEAKAGYYTSYCDGTQDGCYWNGVANSATATRSSQSRAGGVLKDLYTTYHFMLTHIVGAGAVTQKVSIDEYASLPGGELNNIKTDPRQMTITGRFVGDSEQELHDYIQALYIDLSNDSYPGNQPIKLRFSGARVQKEIGVHYSSGLEGDLPAYYCEYEPGDDNWTKLDKWVVDASIVFQAPDPFWYEIGEAATLLATNDSATFRVVASRLKSIEQWSVMGPPNVAGTYTGVYAIVEDATYVYFGGNFLNFDNIANADYVVRYDKQTGVYSALAGGLNGIVWDMAIAPNGNLYIVGEFTNAGGIAAADYITMWDGAAFNAVGVPVAGTAAITRIFGVKLDLTGNIIVTGVFADFANVANADYIAKWNGTAWVAVGNPNSGGAAITDMREVGIDGLNRIWVVGNFTTLAGVANADYIARWDGTTWASVGLTGGAITTIYTIDIAKNGIIYIGGNMVGPWGNYITSYNGTSWNAVGSGLNGSVRKIRIGTDNIVYISGTFTIAGGITLANYIAGWNGSSYFHFDIVLPGAPAVVYSLLPSKYYDPVVKQNYNIYLGFDTAGTGNYGGKVSASNIGSAPTFPKIIFTRSSGTTAVVETLRNERTAKVLLFNYSLLSGETLTVDLDPTKKIITSSYFGLRLDAVLPNSDFGEWQLLSGSNSVTSFVSTSGAPTITAYLLWRNKYKSWD